MRSFAEPTRARACFAWCRFPIPPCQRTYLTSLAIMNACRCAARDRGLEASRIASFVFELSARRMPVRVTPYRRDSWVDAFVGQFVFVIATKHRGAVCRGMNIFEMGRQPGRDSTRVCSLLAGEEPPRSTLCDPLLWTTTDHSGRPDVVTRCCRTLRRFRNPVGFTLQALSRSLATARNRVRRLGGGVRRRDRLTSGHESKLAIRQPRAAGRDEIVTLRSSIQRYWSAASTG